MAKRILVIDDDVLLVGEVRTYLVRHSPETSMTGPPDLLSDLEDIREKSSDAIAVIVDLNIGGSSTYGRSILKKMCRAWARTDTRVLVWSKYLNEVIVYEPDGIKRLTITSGAVASATIVRDFKALADADRISDLRGACSNIRAFVSKAVPEPVEQLISVLQYLKLLSAAKH